MGGHLSPSSCAKVSGSSDSLLSFVPAPELVLEDACQFLFLGLNESWKMPLTEILGDTYHLPDPGPLTSLCSVV